MKSSLQFWKEHLAKGTLLTAVKNHPAHARRFFGALPTLRKNERELAVILAAKEIKRTNPVELQKQVNRIVREEMRDEFKATPADIRRRFSRILSGSSREAHRRAARVLSHAKGKSGSGG